METATEKVNWWVVGFAIIAIISSLLGLSASLFTCICYGPQVGWALLEATALVLAVMAYKGTSDYKPANLVIISIAISLSFFTSMTIADINERKSLEPAFCRGNIGSLATAVNMYMQDYDNNFPSPEKWNDQLRSYVGYDKVFTCPSEKDQSLPSYAMNGQLKRLSEEDIADPENTVLLFESKSGKNLYGGPELLPEKPRHYKCYSVVFIDGDEKSLSRDEILKLNWNPKKLPTSKGE